jgi:hypothetical protein
MDPKTSTKTLLKITFDRHKGDCMKMLLVIASLFVSLNSFAKDTFDGCGLGWEVTQDKTMIATTTRMTTNAVVPPTFGMTTGSLGCEKFSGFAANEKQNVEYVAKNFEVLRTQLATGNGEYVTTTAQSFNCDSAAFSSHVQKNYETVVAPAKDGVELYMNLKKEAGNVCS